MMVVQEKSPQKRADACIAILTSVQSDAILWSSYEAHFHLFGTVKKQTQHYWATENPCELHRSGSLMGLCPPLA